MQEFSTVVGMLLSGIFVGSPDPLLLGCYNIYLGKIQ